MTSPAADCVNCTPPHPYRLHSLPGERCEVSGCECLQFKEAESKTAHTTHCYVCGRLDHAAGFCPYVRREKAVGW